MDKDNDKLEWHTIKGVLVAMSGSQIVALVEKVEGMPCESFGVNMMTGVFTSETAAKECVEKSFQKFVDSERPPKELPSYGKIARAIADIFDPPPVPTDASAGSQAASPEAK